MSKRVKIVNFIIKKFLDGKRGKVSDDSHTFDELYRDRAHLFAAVCNQNPDSAWKSKLHSDGTMFNGYFIVGIETEYGQFTYHYEMRYWDLYKVKEIKNAPEWDGHTSSDIYRIHKIS